MLKDCIFDDGGLFLELIYDMNPAYSSVQFSILEEQKYLFNEISKYAKEDPLSYNPKSLEFISFFCSDDFPKLFGKNASFEPKTFIQNLNKEELNQTFFENYFYEIYVKFFSIFDWNFNYCINSTTNANRKYCIKKIFRNRVFYKL